MARVGVPFFSFYAFNSRKISRLLLPLFSSHPLQFCLGCQKLQTDNDFQCAPASPLKNLCYQVIQYHIFLKEKQAAKVFHLCFFSLQRVHIVHTRHLSLFAWQETHYVTFIVVSRKRESRTFSLSHNFFIKTEGKRPFK